MKKALMILALLATGMCARAQDTVVYRSIFGDSITTWEGILIGIPFGVEPMHFFVYSDDTITIEDGKYYFMNTVLSNYIIQNSADIYRIRTLYLRESDTHDKLFGRIKYDDNSVTREFLIMDLSLDVGDTLNTDDWAELNVHPNQLNPVITIDSIYYKDGRKHLRTDFIGKGKHWSTWPPVIYDTLTFIEGVGPDMGLPYFLYALYPDKYCEEDLSFGITEADSCWMTMPNINCYWKDTVFEYHREWVLYHFEYTTQIICSYMEAYPYVDVVYDDSIKLAPNPVRDILVISNIPTGRHDVLLLDIFGKELKKYTFENDTEYIDIHDLQKGIYFILIDNNDKCLVKKIVKL
jgi:hypothetical protein